MKIGYIVDSATGMSQAEIKKHGWEFIPLYLSIDGKEYRDGIDISAKDFYSQLTKDKDVKTSSTPPRVILDTIERARKKYDQVIIYPISSNFSSQCSTIKMLTKNMKDVHVVTSYGIGTAIVDDIKILEELQEKKTIEELIVKANNLSENQRGFAVFATMAWLVKGGRITPAAAGLANMFKLVPILEYKNGILDKFGKGRIFKKTLVKVAKIVKEKFPNNKVYTIYNGGNKEIDVIKPMIEEVLGKVKLANFPPIVGVHSGPGVIAIMAAEAE